MIHGLLLGLLNHGVVRLLLLIAVLLSCWHLWSSIHALRRLHHVLLLVLHIGDHLAAAVVMLLMLWSHHESVVPVLLHLRRELLMRLLCVHR